MLEGVSFDQLRIFIAAAEGGSFSAAGRRLKRAQSVISQAIAGLEDQLGVALFVRGGRYPVLTAEGEVLLTDARAVIGAMSGLKSRARGMAAGLEPELSVAVDVMFPMSVLTKAAAAFYQTFPTTPLRLNVEALGGVAYSVMEGFSQIGIVGSLPLGSPALVNERLLAVQMIFVAAPAHPLARLPGPATPRDLDQHVQLILTDRTKLSQGREFGVLSPRRWRLADLGAKHEFLRAGLGWGSMPQELIARDLADGTLQELRFVDLPSRQPLLMSATYRTDAPPGLAGRWFVERLRQFAGPD